MYMILGFLLCVFSPAFGLETQDPPFQTGPASLAMQVNSALAQQISAEPSQDVLTIFHIPEILRSRVAAHCALIQSNTMSADVKKCFRGISLIDYLQHNKNCTGRDVCQKNICNLDELHAIRNAQEVPMLYLSGNCIQSMPSDIKRFAGLKELFLNDNVLTNLPEQLCEIKTLQIINIDNNRMTHLPASIGKLTDLTMLMASKNCIRDIPKSIERCHSLQVLTLSDNPLQSGTDILCKLTHLETLGLNNTHLYQDDIDQIRRACIDCAVHAACT